MLEGRAATKGQSLSVRACESLGMGPEVKHLWFNGISLTFTEEPPDVRSKRQLLRIAVAEQTSVLPASCGGSPTRGRRA